MPLDCGFCHSTWSVIWNKLHSLFLINTLSHNDPKQLFLIFLDTNIYVIFFSLVNCLRIILIYIYMNPSYKNMFFNRNNGQNKLFNIRSRNKQRVFLQSDCDFLLIQFIYVQILLKLNYLFHLLMTLRLCRLKQNYIWKVFNLQMLKKLFFCRKLIRHRRAKLCQNKGGL